VDPVRADHRAAVGAPGQPTRSRLERRRAEREGGVPSWLALVVLLGIAGVGGAIDTISGSSLQGTFSWALILGSLVAIVIVRRRQMFPVVIAPPIIYFVASVGRLYITSHGFHNRAKLTDAAVNWLVYGFPAIAGATAVVLLVAGVRLVTRR
jgi:Gpi18-like mannosyltransferase